MASSIETSRRLPANPSREHLRKLAKRLAKSERLQLAAAQRRLAAEHGYASWAALMRAVDDASRKAQPPLAPLHAAAARADADRVRALLAGGEAPDGDGAVNSPLWLVCDSDAPPAQKLAVARQLLDAGASLRRSNEGNAMALPTLLVGATPAERQDAFGIAVINKRVESAKLCLDAGADVNAFLPVHRHATALHEASFNDDVAMLEMLVARGARLDARDTLWNDTPLDWAVYTGKRKAEACLRARAEKGG